MKVLLTGANGYIGKRLLLVLAEAGHDVVAMVRNQGRLKVPDHIEDRVSLIEGDLLRPSSLKSIPRDIEVAYYLVHSMGQQASGFSKMEADCARHFCEAIEQTQAQQIVYLSGLSRDEVASEHMASRHAVEDILSESEVPLTVLRAGIIIGSGSASFEIMRDLVEKLPVMIAPRWVYSKCQPIGISDVLFYLSEVLGDERLYGRTFDIGGPDILTYKQMLQRFASLRHLKRFIIPVPFLTPYLSSLWLFLITNTNFSLARALVRSLTTNAVCSGDRIQDFIPRQCMGFDEAIERAFEKMEQSAVLSSWKDALVRSQLDPNVLKYIEVPLHGCLFEEHECSADVAKEEVLDRLWSIGGSNGWYYMDWAWTLRGWVDRLMGGVGLRRGRTHPASLAMGDALDFWRVVVADRERGHLLLYAEMRLPGEAWLEWKVKEEGPTTTLKQRATFRPRGLLGRLYWYSLVPIHYFIFSGLCESLLKGKK